MKTLFVIVNPTDRPSFDDAFLWDQLKLALAPFSNSGSSFERLDVPTETNLTQALSRNNFDVLHIMTHPQDGESATYGTVALLSSANHSRHLSAKHFASLMADFPSLKLIVLQGIGSVEKPFLAAAQALLAKDFPAVICAPSFRSQIEQIFITTLHRGLQNGLSLQEIAKEYASLANSPGNESLARVSVQGKDQQSAIFASGDLTRPMRLAAGGPAILPPAAAPNSDLNLADLAAAGLRPQPIAPGAPAPSHDPRPANANSSEPAFISYCHSDSEFALRLAEDLKNAGGNVWLDQKDIVPGTSWDHSVENALVQTNCLLVLLSPSSVVSQNVADEVSYALSKRKRVIPVLYKPCEIPYRWARLQYVDFTGDYSRALKMLLQALNPNQSPSANPK